MSFLQSIHNRKWLRFLLYSVKTLDLVNRTSKTQLATMVRISYVPFAISSRSRIDLFFYFVCVAYTSCFSLSSEDYQ